MRLALVVLVAIASAARADAPAAAIPVYSVWSGTYVCGQGTTALRLTIEASKTGAATAKFEFGPTPVNKHIPSGAYWMKGTLRPVGRGELAVVLVPDRWIVQPTGYVMVGLTARVDVEQRALAGKIDFSNCGAIAVKRVLVERE